MQVQRMNRTENDAFRTTTAPQPTERLTIMVSVLRLLEHVTSDWDLDLVGGIRPDTQLVRDLGFSSTDIWFFGGKIQEEFNRWDLPFGELHLFDGDAITDLSVVELVDFLQHHLDPGKVS